MYQIKFVKPEDISMGGKQYKDRLSVKVTDSLSFRFKGEKQFGIDIRYVLPDETRDTVDIAQ